MKPLLLVNIFVRFFFLLLYPYRAKHIRFFDSRSACSDLFGFSITSFCRTYCIHIYPFLAINFSIMLMLTLLLRLSLSFYALIDILSSTGRLIIFTHYLYIS
jgi:hypothetical protein